MKNRLKNIFFPAGTRRRGVGFRAMLVVLAALGLAAAPSRALAASYQNMGNDRILLMNNDSRSVNNGRIEYQGYYDTNRTVLVNGVARNVTYWTHEPALDNRRTTTGLLLHGTQHVLYSPEDEPLWRLEDCRAGYVKVGARNRNTLPYSRYAQPSVSSVDHVYDEDGEWVDCYDNAANATIVMRNTMQARVYSPFYTDGIGTIYFDTVNSHVNASEGAIALQICTNLTEEAIAVGNVSFENVHKEVPFEKWNDYYEWKTVPMTILYVKGTSITNTVETTNLVMAVKSSSSEGYYRCRTRFNYYGPMRFRICRTAIDSGSNVDNTGLILIDNVIASYPPTTVKLERYGDSYDPELGGTSVIGCTGDFDRPFLSYADQKVNTQLHFSWVTNFQGIAQDLRLSDPEFWYRWRYLDQKVNDWQSIPLTTDKNNSATDSAYIEFEEDSTITQLVSVAGIKLADGVGDLEYYYTARTSCPYYRIRDYANDSATVFGKNPGANTAWSEEIKYVTNRLEVAEDFRTPALGNHHFTRIREGISDYKWVKLCTTVTTNGAEGVKSEDIRMELVGDHTWRTHYYVPTNMVGETFSFHFQGEQLYTNRVDVGYHSRTNTWYCDLKELPYIPYTSAAGLGYHNDISCRLDDAATHLLIEFNDELLSFSICHAAYQSFNAWTDATVGYVGHTNWNGMGAIGVSDKKQKFVMDDELRGLDGEGGWTTSSFVRDEWREAFDTTDYKTYPFNQIFDEHRTPNGWTAGHGQFVRAVRGLEGNMSLQMEGRGQGWIGMEGFTEDVMPKGVDTVKFKARVAQEPRFEDFAWYMDGTSLTNYAISARLAMGHEGGTLGNAKDISPGTPSVSLVGYYRPTVGCYEFRITRCGPEQLCAAIYKWLPKSSGMTATLLASNVVAVSDNTAYARPGPNQTAITSFGNYLVPSGSNKSARANGSNAYLLIHRTGSTVRLRGVLSSGYGSDIVSADKNLKTLVEITDTQNAFSKGTYGVGSTDCMASFMAMQKHTLIVSGTTVEINTAGSYVGGLESGDWAFYRDRWTFDPSFSITPGGKSNLEATLPTNQTVRLEFKSATGGNGWQPSGQEMTINSFGTNVFQFVSRVSPNYQVRLRTGGNSYDDVRTDVVVDDLEVSSWRAPDYPGLAYYNGQSGRWVYMCGVVTNVAGTKLVHLQPSRGVEERAMGIRSPYLENGISMFSANYRNADSHAKLLLQVCTNLTSVGGVSESLTTYPSSNYNWTTVTNFDFSAMSATARQRGTLTHYMSFRAPVHGLVRLVVDESVIRHCRETETLPTRDINYGQIMIESAYCYDEPALDMRSWYAWNFHTAGWNTADKRFAYLFDSPDGLSGSLNFSALNSDNNTEAAQGIGLTDQANLAAYAANNSFVQCPPLTNGIGSVSFRARTFDTAANRKSSWVTLYGSFEPDDDQVVAPESWQRITDFEITNTTYQTFSWATTDDTSQFKAIRLEVAGSRHGRSPSISSSADWEKPKATPLQRVFIDEISVGEPIQPRIVFRNVRPFRSGLVDIPAKVVPNVTDLSEQPLLGESWGLQCTIEPQQMSDQLDDSSLVVYAAFKRGISPWGYANWSNHVAAVRLDRIPGTLTFRSTYNTPDSIISPADTPSSFYPENVWQYYLWCEFKDKDGNKHRHSLDSLDWTVPDWYWGIRDLNETYRSQGFAGYTILDTISPKRAWINEVNICDDAGNSMSNDDAKQQFIEVAVPRGADLSNWYINVVANTIVTGSDGVKRLNRGSIARFGYYDAKINPNPKLGTCMGKDWTNDYTVVALRSPAAGTRDSQGVISGVAAADGTWDTLSVDTCNMLSLARGGNFYSSSTYGIELVRPSGVIEHQIIVQGTNPYAGTSWEWWGSGTNMLNDVLSVEPGAQWFFVGCDDTPKTLGVFKSHGEDASCWTNVLVSTASELNKFEDDTRQIIDANWFLKPNGTNVWIYATVLGGHLHQAIGNKTKDSEVFIIRKGTSTNIVYTTDKWWRMGEVTTNGVVVAEAKGRGDRGADNHTWTLHLPDVNETVTVYAKAEAGSDVADVGMDASDPYFPAVMAWLGDKDDSGGLYMAEDWSLSNQKLGMLELKDMYWLDIDPTQDGWVFKSGMGGGSAPVQPVLQPIYDLGNDIVYTNDRVTVTMMITNRITNVARKPDHLLGLEPGSSSIDYNLYSPAWTSVTFKIVGALRNGDAEVQSLYLPLRWFVFGPDSFDDDFTATIDIWDPHSRNSPGWFYGWGDFPGVPVWYKYRLDGEPAYYDTAEMLNKNSIYSE